jgi:hypothetical protein
MTEPAKIATAYIDLWNETNPALRRAMISAAWSNDASYVGPMMRGEGHDQINALIGAVHTRYPGHRFTLTHTPDGYGNHVPFRWTLAPDAGPALAEGTDFVTLGDTGLLRSVTGFLDVVTA